ncbi:MAG: glycosyltransferase family 4 protein [Nitrospirae bacterium]|nr:glycosyltransferase family 4 protein [Nitrospirota bacterium]
MEQIIIMSNTKILRIIARLNIGGPAIHTILLSSELDRIGYKTILVKGTEGPREGSMTDLAESKGIKPVVISELGREIGFKNDLIAFYKLFKLIKEEKPDIVHTHTAKAGTLGRVAAWLAGVPIIIHTFHGHVLHGYFGKLKTWVFVQIEKMLALISTRLITLSEVLKNELINMGIGNEKKFEVVPLGLELRPFLENNPPPPPLSNGGVGGFCGEFKKELGLPEDTILIGIIGRLVPIKGHRYFLEATKIISSQLTVDGSQLEVKFVIVGDGELREELEDYAKKLGISDIVIFTGFRRDLTKIYAGIDIIALTSLNEGTPVSIIEAMASGKPVVATNVGGVPALVKNGITGFLVPPKRPDLFADAVLKLLNDPLLMKKMGEEGRRRVFPQYDVSSLIKRIDSLYTALLNPQP